VAQTREVSKDLAGLEGGFDMKATPLPLLLIVFFLAGCSNISIEGQFLQPADVTATALAASIRAAPTSTSDLVATAIERAVELTLTAAVPSPTNTLPPSPTPEPTTAVPPTDTPAPTTAPTATRKPTLALTAAPTQPPTPQVIFLRPRCGTTYTVQADRPLEIRYGSWLAKGADLAAQNAQHLTVRLVLDGVPVTGVQQPVVPGSAFPCGASAEAYGVFYVAQVGPLSAGTHVASQTFIFDEQVTDGGDYNGDGALDLYGPGEVFTSEFTIIAQ
jgi:hypothetical protein